MDSQNAVRIARLLHSVEDALRDIDNAYRELSCYEDYGMMEEEIDYYDLSGTLAELRTFFGRIAYVKMQELGKGCISTTDSCGICRNCIVNKINDSLSST